jgi:hypothetical protein
MNSELIKKYFNTSAKAILVAVLGLTLSTGIVYADKDGDSKKAEKSENSGRRGQVIWLNHFDLQANDPLALTTASNSPASGIFPDLSGVVITPLIAGTPSVQMALDLPKETKITGVKICYTITGASSFISQVKLAQVNVQNPVTPDNAVTDDTDLMSLAPICVDSRFSRSGIKAKNGPVVLSLGLSADPANKILIRGIGVYVK